MTIDRQFLLVNDEREAARIDAQTEDADVLVDDAHFSLADLLEDECLLALPAFVVHVHCPAISLDRESTPPAQANPFALLATLKSGKRRI